MATTYMGPHGEDNLATPAAKSTASIVAILSSIISFIMSARGQEFWALALAVIGIGAGLLGGMRSLSPHVKGGILSILAVILGVIAILVAVIALFV